MRSSSVEPQSLVVIGVWQLKKTLRTLQNVDKAVVGLLLVILP